MHQYYSRSRLGLLEQNRWEGSCPVVEGNVRSSTALRLTSEWAHVGVFALEFAMQSVSAPPRRSDVVAKLARAMSSCAEHNHVQFRKSELTTGSRTGN